MGWILNIDTATSHGGICLAKDGTIISVAELSEQKDHAGWMHVAIKNLLEEQGHSLHILDAVAITAGPGSYTGLRVAMAAAKGICFALDIPLITENTLKVMACGAIEWLKDKPGYTQDHLLCPMLDARRMEVFTALYSFQLDEIMPPAAMVLDENSFKETLQQKKIFFFGNGASKFESILQHPNATFITPSTGVQHLSALSTKKFAAQDFADLAYSEPFYLKAFHDTTR